LRHPHPAFSALFACAVIAVASAAAPSPALFAEAAPGGVQATLDIECHSGTPPVLELVLRDPGRTAKTVGLDFESDGVVDLELRNGGEEVIFRGVPYRDEGTYTLSAYMDTDGGKLKREYLVSFVDFRWGRDNFAFANDGKFENAAEFVSKTVVDWVEDRFGDAARGEELLLRYLMYSLYKGSIGRCYGFTGLQMLYLEKPELLPAPYRSIYDVDESDERVVKLMDWLQNDMVFANFVSGPGRLAAPFDAGPRGEGNVPGAEEVSETGSAAELETELDAMRCSILRGKPIIFGYVGNELHHAMVVYGFFRDLRGGRTTLLAANNWVREQRDNVYSEDAENIVIDPRDEFQPVTWYDLTKQKYRHVGRFFALGVRDFYELDGKAFAALLAGAKKRIVENGRIILMVENTGEAYVVDRAGRVSGFVGKEIVRESETTLFKKIDYNYVFEVPAGETSTLVLNKRVFNKERGAYKEVNLYGIVPNPGGYEPVVFTGLRVPFLSPLAISVGRNGIAVRSVQ
jgi:hypothetical protein